MNDEARSLDGAWPLPVRDGMRLCSVAPGACPPLEPFYSLHIHFSPRSMLIREPVVSDHYMLAYRIRLQQRSLAQRSQEAL